MQGMVDCDRMSKPGPADVQYWYGADRTGSVDRARPLWMALCYVTVGLLQGRLLTLPYLRSSVGACAQMLTNPSI